MSDVLSAGSPDRFGYEWDRYSEIRTAATANLPKVEMSYIGG